MYRFKGLAPEDMLIYQLIEEVGNQGMWKRDLKSKSNLQLSQITKILKTLEQRKLIKSVPASTVIWLFVTF
jgi:DNA-directed RNA polymerase III subunit RPC6